MHQVVRFLISLGLFIYTWLEGIILTFVPRRFRYKDVKDETVLITGGGSGIGRLLAVRFSALGCRVIIWDVNEKGNEETVDIVKKHSGECYSYTCDVTKKDMVYATAQKVKDEIGSVTVLVNNAGIVTGKKLLDCPDDMIEKTFQVNTLAHFWTTKAFLPDMISNNHGHIITVSSLAGCTGINGLTDYCSSKFATVGFHECLSLELKKDNLTGVKTTLICPFFISTGLFDGSDPGFFSLLEPEYVADQIVAGMRCNEEIIILPGYFAIIIALKNTLPASTFGVIYETLKGYTAMDKFVGRTQKRD